MSTERSFPFALRAQAHSFAAPEQVEDIGFDLDVLMSDDRVVAWDHVGIGLGIELQERCVRVEESLHVGEQQGRPISVHLVVEVERIRREYHLTIRRRNPRDQLARRVAAELLDDNSRRNLVG